MFKKMQVLYVHAAGAYVVVFVFFLARKIKNLELKKSGKFFYLCEFLGAVSFVEPSSKFNLLCFFLVFTVNFGSGLSGLGPVCSFDL
jgi:hypothetical protein